MNWLDEVYRIRTELSEVSYVLNKLSSGFLITHNHDMADELLELSFIVKNLADDLSNATGDKISGDLKEARANFFGAFSAVLDTLPGKEES